MKNEIEKTPIIKIQPGQWNAFVKCLKHLPFLTTIQINNSCINVEIANNAWLCVDLSGVLGGSKANFAFMNSDFTWKELAAIPSSNAPIEIYEINDRYVFTNGKAITKVKKYPGFNKPCNFPDDKSKAIQIGTTSLFGKSDTKTLFKLTKKKGPIDLIIVKAQNKSEDKGKDEDELVAVGNALGSLFPVVQNTVKDILNKEPDSMYRSFSFDRLDGKTVVLDLFKAPEDLDSFTGLPNTWLHAQITIDTAIKFNFFERLIPIAKHNWHN